MGRKRDDDSFQTVQQAFPEFILPILLRISCFYLLPLFSDILIFKHYIKLHYDFVANFGFETRLYSPILLYSYLLFDKLLTDLFENT
jgi:hypothetical protein